MSPEAEFMLINKIAPLINGAVRRGAIKIVGCEDHDELVQDCMASAAQMLTSAEEKNKAVTPGNVAYYVLQNAKSGRRSTGASSTDALSPTTQLRGRSSLRSLDAPIAFDDDECASLHQVIAGSAEDPSVAAAQRIDWGQMLPFLDDRARSVLCSTAEGITVKAIAEHHKISAPRVVQIKREIAAVIYEHFGTEILVAIGEETLWKKGIRAVREREACRYERSCSL